MISISNLQYRWNTQWSLNIPITRPILLIQPIMNMANLSGSDNNNTDASLSCEMCNKSYQRRMSFLRMLASLLIYLIKATYLYAIAGAAKDPKDLPLVVKLAMPVLSQGPSAVTPGPHVCVVSAGERNAYTLYRYQRRPRIFRSYRANLLMCPNQAPNTLLRRRGTLRVRLCHLN